MTNETIKEQIWLTIEYLGEQFPDEETATEEEIEKAAEIIQKLTDIYNNIKT